MMMMNMRMIMVARVIKFKAYMNLSKILPKILQHGADWHGELLRVTHYDDDEDDDDFRLVQNKGTQFLKLKARKRKHVQ